MSLKLEVEDYNSACILKIIGLLDYSTIDVNEIINEKIEEVLKFNKIIIDFSALEFIDSTGVGAILGLIYSAKNTGSSIEFRNMNSNVRELFETIGIFRVIESLLRD